MYLSFVSVLLITALFNLLMQLESDQQHCLLSKTKYNIA